jgi:cell division protein FtsL
MIRSYSPLLFWLGMTIASSIMLYHTSDRVHALDVEMRKLNAQIEAEQKSIHVLKAEWVYLSNPARVEAQAKRHLGLQETVTNRIAALASINDLVPMRDGSAPPEKTVGPATIAATAKAAVEKPRTERDRVLASVNAGRINDRMKIQQPGATIPSTDKIGVLIGQLGLRP